MVPPVLQLNFDVGLNFAYNDIEAIWEKYREWYLNEEGKLNEKRRSFQEKPSRLGFSNPFQRLFWRRTLYFYCREDIENGKGES